MQPNNMHTRSSRTVNPPAGIDLGGTKILSVVFDETWLPLSVNRVVTPNDSYNALLSQLIYQIEWIQGQTSISTIGLGVPGILDRKTFVLRAANLAADGHRLSEDLQSATGVGITVINDSKAFALSEACLGAGADFCSVLGISIGTGTAAGLVTNGRILSSAAGMAGEIGHMSVPVSVAQKYNLPVLPCACGKAGCYETFISGPGLTRLGQVVFDCRRSATEWSALQIDGDDQARELMTLWYEVLAAMVADVVLCYDPECIVFGGGLSALPEFISNISNALDNTDTLTEYKPQLFEASGKDYSGARGAALQALI